MADNRDYPKMLYHSDGRTEIVHSPEQEKGLNGFETTPSEIHTTPRYAGASVVTPAGSGNDDLIAKIRQLFEEFIPNEKRGPGRPRKENDNG